MYLNTKILLIIVLYLCLTICDCEIEEPKIPNQNVTSKPVDGNAEFNNNTRNETIKETLEARILRQVEYYFSDENLPTDHYLQRRMFRDKGYIEISLLLRFNLLATLTKDVYSIVSAIRNCNNTILEVDHTGRKVRRRLEYPLPVWGVKLDKLVERTVFCTGFPKTASTDELLDFVDTFDTKVVRIVLQKKKRDFAKTFNGNIFLIFSSKEKAERFKLRNTFKFRNYDIMIVKETRKWETYFRKIHRKHSFTPTRPYADVIKKEEFT